VIPYGELVAPPFSFVDKDVGMLQTVVPILAATFLYPKNLYSLSASLLVIFCRYSNLSRKYLYCVEEILA
jgi:hypothetical protein